MLSARLVTAAGEVVQVSAVENSELWWGLRGAGHSFGIMSQLTVKAYSQLTSFNSIRLTALSRHCVEPVTLSTKTGECIPNMSVVAS
jgi:hypothetical protein